MKIHWAKHPQPIPVEIKIQIALILIAAAFIGAAGMWIVTLW